MPAPTSLWLERVPDVRRYPPLAGDVKVDVVVVGGGLAGVSAAYFLARAGRRVALLEANHLGTGETGYTTAFLTSSVDTPFADLRTTYGDTHIRSLRTLGEEAITRVEKTVATEGIACGFHRVDAFVLARTAETAPHLAREAKALLVAGGESETLSGEAARAATGLPVAGTLRIPRQATFDARAYLLALAERVVRRGGAVYEETRMTRLQTGEALRVVTSAGTLTASRVVLATGLLPPLFQAALRQVRQNVTYVSAFALPDRAHGGTLPDALYWDVTTPFHYARFLYPESGRGANGSFLLGGEDRPVREARAAGEAPWEALESFTTNILGAPVTATHRWRGQILETSDAFPLAGPAPGEDPCVLVCTGFGGNGMTFGTASAETVARLVRGILAAADNPLRLDRKNLTAQLVP